MVSQLAHHDDVPDRFSEGSAGAMADGLHLVADSDSQACTVRALNWSVALHDSMLRLPPQFGREGKYFVAELHSLVGR